VLMYSETTATVMCEEYLGASSSVQGPTAVTREAANPMHPVSCSRVCSPSSTSLQSRPTSSSARTARSRGAWYTTMQDPSCRAPCAWSAHPECSSITPCMYDRPVLVCMYVPARHALVLVCMYVPARHALLLLVFPLSAKVTWWVEHLD